MKKNNLIFFDSSTLLLLVLVLITLVLPKINIISVFGTGIRIDDFLLGIFGLFLLLASLRVQLDSDLTILLKFFKIVVMITILGILSWSVSYALDGAGIAGLFFALRLLEYSMFLFVGYMLSSKIDLVKFVLILATLNLLVVFMQKAGMIGGFPTGAYQSNLTTRPIGLTSGPWEVVVILAFGATYILYSKPFSTLLTGSIITLFTAGIIFLDSRIGILSFVLVATYFLLKGKSIKFIFTGIIFFVPIFLFGAFQVISHSDRASRVFESQNYEFIQSALDAVDIDNYEMNNPTFNKFGSFDKLEGDVSLAARSLKWIYVVKTTLDNKYRLLIGSGPGSFGVAVDGAYIRILGELGVLGLLLYILLLVKAIRLNPVVAIFVSVVAINALFIDVLFASRVMSVLFLLIGYSVAMNKPERVTIQIKELN